MVKVTFLISLLLPAFAWANSEICNSALLPFNSPLRAESTVKSVLERVGIVVNGTRAQDLQVRDSRFYKMVLADPELKLGETYMDGMWDSEAIDQLLFQLMKVKQTNRLEVLSPLFHVPVLTLEALLKKSLRYFRDSLTNRQTRELSKNVAVQHYDVGSDLYRLMLDPTLTYTSGVWSSGYTLEDAQNAKYDLICRKLGIKPGDRVLDIGSGFGGFARFAAKNYGAEVTGITISVEQLKAARALSADVAGVDFQFSDYRDIPFRFGAGTFDHIVSIEMIEAVGIKNLPTYFEIAHVSLKEGGNFLVQGIESQEDVVSSNPWFSKYIFQDGVAPSRNQVDNVARSLFGKATDRQYFTADYDRTLLEWHSNFSRAWPELSARYSARFKRMWDFYLLSVAGGFRAHRVELSQTLFTKGALPGSYQPVRDLPSRERLTNLRQSAEDKARTKSIIAEIDNQNLVTTQALTQVRTKTGAPLHKNARIAIVGAGPGGLSAGAELRRLGYTNVQIFEKAPEVGGKSHTVTYDGRPHDMGATMGIPKKYAGIVALAKEQGQPTIPFPQQIDYDLNTGRPLPPSSLSKRLQLAFQALVYMVRHEDLTGKNGRGLEVPPAELADPWQVVMSRHNLGLLGDRMKTYLTGYGYGGPDAPAVFAYRMLDINAILGSALSKPIMWQNGTQPIWKGLAQQLNVQTDSDVVRIDRDANAVTLNFADGRKPEVFDRLIMAVDPLVALKILDATPEENAVYSQVRHMPYATFAVRVNGFAEGRSEVGYLRENMTLEREGHPMAWIKRYPDDNLFIFHLFAPANLSDAQILANIESDLSKLGATHCTLVDSRRWPFFPHVDATAIREHRFFERAVNLQGQNRTVFVNEALGMSTMPDSAKVGQNAADRLASGEYGD